VGVTWVARKGSLVTVAACDVGRGHRRFWRRGSPGPPGWSEGQTRGPIEGGKGEIGFAQPGKHLTNSQQILGQSVSDEKFSREAPYL
jgi:hypothetical protein